MAPYPITMAAKLGSEPRATLSSRVYARLRQEIITGRHAPGKRLRIQELCTQFGVGLSPMREALTGLSRDGLVWHEEQRGFSIAWIDEAHLEELTKTRCWLNELGIRESIANGDAHWAEGVQLAYQRLNRLPTELSENGDRTFNPAWEEAHRAFHTSLIAACGSFWLITYCEQLFDAADFYRNVSRVPILRRSQRHIEHEHLMKAALARDPDAAAQLLSAHIRRTSDLVRERLAINKPP